MGTPALFFYSVLWFCVVNLNKLYGVNAKKARKSAKFLYFWGQKRAMSLICTQKWGFLQKNIDKKIFKHTYITSELQHFQHGCRLRKKVPKVQKVQKVPNFAYMYMVKALPWLVCCWRVFYGVCW